MNPDKAKDILKEGVAILKGLETTWWLSAGTALGAYRDGLSDAFLEKDSDIDVEVLADNAGDSLNVLFHTIRLSFIKNGFELVRAYKTEGFWSQSAFIKKGVYFDIYYYFPKGDTLVNYNEYGIFTLEKSFILNREPITLFGESYLIPSPIESYLFTRFGEDWKVPTDAKNQHRWEDGASNLTRKKLETFFVINEVPHGG